MNPKVMFDLDLYPEHCVREAIFAYRHIATFLLNIQDNQAICTLVSSFYQPEETIWEFSNYLLGLSAKVMR